MRDLMNEATVVPPWLHDTFLGYGDPAAAQYLKLPDFVRTVDFKVPLWLAVGAAQLGDDAWCLAASDNGCVRLFAGPFASLLG